MGSVKYQSNPLLSSSVSEDRMELESWFGRILGRHAASWSVGPFGESFDGPWIQEDNFICVSCSFLQPRWWLFLIVEQISWCIPVAILMPSNIFVVNELQSHHFCRSQLHWHICWLIWNGCPSSQYILTIQLGNTFQFLDNHCSLSQWEINC